MNKLLIYFTPTHSNIEIQEHPATRSTSAARMPDVLGNLSPEDRATVEAFCTAVLECLKGKCTALAAYSEKG